MDKDFNANICLKNFLKPTRDLESPDPDTTFIPHSSPCVLTFLLTQLPLIDLA